MNEEYLIGIDLGGTKIEGVILHKPDLKVIIRERIPTEGSKGYWHVLNQIKKLIDNLVEKTGLTFNNVGICTPGTLDPITGLMKNCNSVFLNGQPMKVDLEEILQLRVRMSNDANCFVMAEFGLGVIKEKCKSATNVFGIIMGTGVGGGMIINGKLVEGLHGIAGEWGHNIIDPDGNDCYCGKKGCIETVISGIALERYYLDLAGKKKSLVEIVLAYRSQEDHFAKQTMHRLFHYFGLGISTLINVFDPDAIVIGGGVGNIDELYTIGVEKIRNYIFNDRLETLILKPLLGDSAGVFGAALL